MHSLASSLQENWQFDAAGGLSVSGSAVSTRHGHRSVHTAGLRLIMLLEGSLSVRFGREAFRLTQRGDLGAEVLLVNLNREDEFERLEDDYAFERKICMLIPAGWLAARGELGGALADFRREHLAVARWRAGPALANLAARLLAAREDGGLQDKLQRESMALQLLAELLAMLGSAVTLLPYGHTGKRLLQIRTLLDSGAANDWSLERIAAEACMSPATLQRHFRRAYGSSVCDYLRLQRLQQARRRLEHGEATVMAAALDAGYSSPANFSTAFRRVFGMPPRDCLPAAASSKACRQELCPM